MDRMQRRSKRLFNREHRLAVLEALATAKGGTVVAKKLAKELDVGSGVVTDELLKLAELGLVTPQPEPGQREVPYRRSTNRAFWRGCKALHEEWKADG
jgi:Mn-dependent DtxR family transcriptional regulator